MELLEAIKEKVISSVKETIRIEAESVLDQLDIVNSQFPKAIHILLNVGGKVVVTGMGKSGIIGRKISATFASTGTPSFFLHPAEAYHGDLGMVSNNDVILALSNSGETDEILKIIPFFKSNGNAIVSITGNDQSTLALNSEAHLLIRILKEACPLSLAPTSSTTVSLVIGDALAVCLMKLKNFKHEGFAKFHPGGNIGKRLLSKAQDVMRRSNLPIANPDSNISEILNQITRTRLGIVVILSDDKVVGVITDGDLRRFISKFGKEIFEKKAIDFMTNNAKTVLPTASLSEVEELMRLHKIHSAPVVNLENRLLGVIELFDTSN